jgi:hypothetical protein
MGAALRIAELIADLLDTVTNGLESFPINRKRPSFNLGEQFHPIILNHFMSA